MPEYLDVIDKSNKVIGKETRRKCYEKGLLHRGIHILIFNSGGQLLLQKRSRKKKTFPGYWTSSVSGHVETGSTYEEAALRELKEEIGIKVKLKRVCDFYAEEKSNNLIDREIIRLFSGICEGPFNPNIEEVEDIKFFYIKDLEHKIKEGKEKLTPNFIKAFKEFRKKYQ